MKGMHKDWRQMVKKYKKLGWALKTTGGNHVKWEHPEHGKLFSPLTCSDKRGIKNFERDLRNRMKPKIKTT